MSDKVVIGIFEDYAQAGKAIQALRDGDYRAEDISIVGADPEETRMASVDLQRHSPDKVVVAGSILGAAGGWLVGLAALAIPGVGPFIAAGPLLSALSGAAAGGLIGTFAGALIHFDIPEYEAKIYEGHLSAGKILVAVHTHDKAERVRAEDIMDDCGAIEIDSRTEPVASLPGPGVPSREIPSTKVDRDLPNPNTGLNA
jgi:hypothetical protein